VDGTAVDGTTVDGTTVGGRRDDGTTGRRDGGRRDDGRRNRRDDGATVDGRRKGRRWRRLSVACAKKGGRPKAPAEAASRFVQKGRSDSSLNGTSGSAAKAASSNSASS